MKAKEIKTEITEGVCDKNNLHVLINSLYGDKFSFCTITTDEGKTVLQMSIAQYYESVVSDDNQEQRAA